METKNLQAQKGFTLVEIAIVLVIIGLLLGGVLKGQELIQNSKEKSVAQQFDNISAAYYAYKDRTGETAGDTTDNGVVDDTGAFWTELRTEGFITGDVADTTGPEHALDGIFSAVVPAAAAAAGVFTKSSICATNIQSDIAEALDRKLDDGDAATGSYRSSDNGAVYAGDESLVTLCKEL